MRNYLMLDIETVPLDIKHEDVKTYLMDKKISKQSRSINPTYSKIIYIGVKPLNKEVKIFSGEEKTILEEFWNYLKLNQDAIIITHNGYNFDIPFIILRSCINNIKIPVNINTNKYSMVNSNHFDTMVFFSYYGTFVNPNLEILGKMHNIDIHKQRVTGSDVERLYKEGKLDLIEEHCKQDVEILEKVFENLCLNYLESSHQR